MNRFLTLDARVAAALLGFGVLAGGAFMFVKVIVAELTPLQLVASRMAMAALSVVVVMMLTRTSVPVSRRYLKGVTVLALLDGVMPYLLIAWAEIHVTSATAAVLLATAPLFTTLFATATGESRSIGRLTVLGLGTGFTGVAMLAGPSALDVGDSSGAGIAAVTLAACCYAAAAVFAKPMLNTASPLALTGSKLVVSSLIVVPLALAVDGVSAYGGMSTEALLSLLVLSLGSTGVGRCAYLWAIAKAGSVKASLVTYIAPGIAIVLSWLVLGETVDARMLAGAGLIAAGVVVVMFGHRLRLLAASLLPTRRIPTAVGPARATR